MSETPGPRAIPSSMRNGRSAAVPSSNTVSMCPTSRTAWCAPRPTRRPISRSPSCACAVGGLVRDAAPRPSPPSRKRASARSAIAFTPAGEYEPQSTFTMVSSAATYSSSRAARRSRSARTSIGARR